MNPQRIADESRLPELLAAFDEALKGSRAAPANIHEKNLSPEELAELERAARCVRLLEDVFPRRPTGAGQPSFLGRFRIQRRLGQGGFGVVYLAHDPHLGRDVALKVPHAHALSDPEICTRFRREAQAAAGLDHPNLVPVYEAGEAGGINYIAFAYCPGKSLAEWLAQRTEPVPCRDAAWLIALLARAVHYAHERGIIHRDLKPANVLLLDRGGTLDGSASGGATGELADDLPKITDFGLAKNLDGALTQTQTGALAGTPNYMAAEQAGAGDLTVGPATDVYALGAILYELLTGKAPFHGSSALETLHKVRFEEPTPPSRLRPRLGRDLETICLKCLEKDPSRRYASAAALARDLECYLDGSPIQARRTSPLGRAVRWCRRKPVIAGLAAALLLALGAGGIGLAWHRQSIARQRAEILRKSAEAAQAWQVAEENLQKAASAAAKADARYETNWSAVDRLMDISDSALRQRRLDAKGRAVIEELLASYQRFTEEKSEDRTVRMRSAWAFMRVANLCGVLGQYEKTDHALAQADRLLERLVQEQPSDKECRAALIHYHSQMAHYQRRKGGKANSLRAVEHYERSLAGIESLLREKHERSHLLVMMKRLVLDNLGRTLIGLGEAERAEQVFRESLDVQQTLLSMMPRSYVHRDALAGALECMSQAAQVRGRLPEAEDWCRQALDIQEELVGEQPSHQYQLHLAWLHGRAAEISRLRGLPDAAGSHVSEAVRLFEQLHAGAPGDHSTAGLLARFLEFKGDHLRETGRLPEARVALGRSLALREQLAQDSPGEPTYRREIAYCAYLLGCALRAQKEHVEAGKAFGKALALHATLPDTFGDDLAYRNEVAWRSRDIADQLRQMRAVTEAERAYRQALAHFVTVARINTGDPEPVRQQARTFQSIGELLFHAGRFNAAKEAFAQALSLRERVISVHKGGKDDAAELLRHRRALADSWLKEADELWNAGQEQATEAAYRTACRVYDGYPEAQNRMAWFLATCADPKLRRPQEAVDLARRAVQATPKAANFHNTLGAAYFSNGDDAAAVETMEQAIRLRGHGVAEDWLFQAMARWRLGDREAARRDYTKAVESMAKDAPGGAELRRVRAAAEALMGISAQGAE